MKALAAALVALVLLTGCSELLEGRDELLEGRNEPLGSQSPNDASTPSPRPIPQKGDIPLDEQLMADNMADLIAAGDEPLAYAFIHSERQRTGCAIVAGDAVFQTKDEERFERAKFVRSLKSERKDVVTAAATRATDNGILSVVVGQAC